jgi:hypothetical protein
MNKFILILRALQCLVDIGIFRLKRIAIERKQYYENRRPPFKRIAGILVVFGKLR